MQALLAAVARLALERPRVTALLVLGPLLALTALAPGVPADLSFGALMDRDHPEVARYLAASRRDGLGAIVLVQLVGPEPRLDEAAGAVARAAGPGTGLVRSLVAVPSPAGPTPGERLLRAVLPRDPLLASIDADDFPRLRDAIEHALAPFDTDGERIEARYAGMAAIVTQEQEATIARMRWLGAASLVLVLALLSRVDRRPAMLAVVGVALALAAGATLGLVGRSTGELTLMESLFGVIVLGLGADFAIHWLLRAREERAAGEPVEQAALRATAGTGRGIVAGALTSGGAFLLLALAPEPVFQRLGVSGGVGLLLAMVALVALLPAAWAASERRGTSGARPLGMPWLARVGGAAARNPAKVLALTAALAAASLALADRFHYETNLERVFSREIEAVGVAHTLRATFGVDPQPWQMQARDPVHAAELVRELEASALFDRALVEPTDDGRLRVLAFARELSLDSARAAEQRRVVQAIAPDATSMVAILEALIGTERPWMRGVVATVAAFVVVVLLLDLRSPRLALLAILPVATGSVCAFGLLCAAGFAWNTVTLVGLPLLLGLGVDDGIHLAHRLRDEPERPIGEIVGSVGPAIALTTATTCASVATLLFSRHPGIESLAVLLGTGLPACLVASVTVLPAAAVVLGVGRVASAPGTPAA